MCSKLCYAVGGAPYQTTGCALGFFLQIYLLDVAQVRPEPGERQPGAGLGGPEPPVPRSLWKRGAGGRRWRRSRGPVWLWVRGLRVSSGLPQAIKQARGVGAAGCRIRPANPRRSGSVGNREGNCGEKYPWGSLVLATGGFGAAPLQDSEFGVERAVVGQRWEGLGHHTSNSVEQSPQALLNKGERPRHPSPVPDGVPAWLGRP